jgi:hypothetical protein
MHEAVVIFVRYYTHLQLLEQFFWCWSQNDDTARTGTDELLHSFVDKRLKRVVVPVHVQQPDLQSIPVVIFNGAL